MRLGSRGPRNYVRADGTLHVEQEAQYRDGDRKRRKLPINDFMCESGPPPQWLQKLIDRMFDDAGALAAEDHGSA